MAHTNGLARPDALLGGMTAAASLAAHRRHVDGYAARAAANPDTAHPSAMGYAMVLEARGNVYGDVRTVDPVTVARRRAKNKAARAARRIGRK